MKKNIPKIREQEWNKKSIPEIQEREGNEKTQSQNSGMGNGGYHSREQEGSGKKIRTVQSGHKISCGSVLDKFHKDNFFRIHCMYLTLNWQGGQNDSNTNIPPDPNIPF